MENIHEIKALFIIANAGFADDIVELTREEGVGGATILKARGEGVRHESFMGITVDAEKDMILSVVDEITAEKAMAAIKEKMGIKTPAHGVCFTIPVDKIVGVNVPILQER